jgi:hypothetical protein
MAGVQFLAGEIDSSLHSIPMSSGAHLARFQRVPGAFNRVVKRLGREADDSPPSAAEVKNGGAIPPFPHVFIAWWLMNYTQGQLYLYRQ